MERWDISGSTTRAILVGVATVRMGRDLAAGYGIRGSRAAILVRGVVVSGSVVQMGHWLKMAKRAAQARPRHNMIWYDTTMH